MMPRNIAASWILAVCCLGLLKLFESQVPLEEVEALQQIATEMGATYWRFNGDICELGMVGVSPTPPSGSEGYVDLWLRVTIFLEFFQQILLLPYLQEMNLEANNFSGLIPSDIGKLINLKSLILSSNQLTGQLPTSFSELTNLNDFRINDNNLSGRIPDFIQNWKQLVRLVLRNCNISGAIPAYIWRLRLLQLMDVSFNKLVGEIPNDIARNLKTVFVTSNMLSGNIPHTILKDGSNIDLSYNNFSLRGPDEAAYRCSLHVNCGGADLTVKENNRRVIYEGDAGGDPTRYLSDNYWGFVSTGDFMDESIYQNSRPIRSTTTTNLSELYTTARLSPLSLTYFHYCLENGSYNENLVRKDFNIEDEARGTGNPVVKYFNATVKNSTLEIRFYWASKGTTRIPNRGDYGSLISAISVNPNFRICSDGNKKNITAIIVGSVAAVCVILLILYILWWKGFLTGRKRAGKDFEGLELQTVAFSLKQIKAATNNFDATNKIGEGGFGPVYKGQLPDGTVIAVKQLSSKSRQGNREFLNEIGMISCLQHPNLVKLNKCAARQRSEPKISDFGLARLNEDEKTHISTKVAGTIGYMAPEYALWGYLTDKVDVYSFESWFWKSSVGKATIITCRVAVSFAFLIGFSVDKEEVERTVRVALRCTNATPSLRPSMSEVVQMIEGKMDIPDGVPEGEHIH
ncbi:hypothetical protein DH2020_009132 [Rehmannia glutinosa]|uniref:non-specific serine/threonine protein kinase n=1 Tax=Rehmannia glutinosa TaxID=99300 RepID=A0ABR0X625_REHGL